MILWDTHCHLAAAAFAPDLGAVLERALLAGLVGLTVVATEPADWSAVRALAPGAPGLTVRCALGLHPHTAHLATTRLWEALAVELHAPGVAAVGEIGLDYHYDHSPRPAQREALVAQLALARAAGLPVVLHERESAADLLDILRAEGPPASGGVWHSFAGDPELARTALDLGLHLGFGGLATFRNGTAAIREAARFCPPDRLLLETDAPYLAPVPHRGRRNEPAFVAATAAFLAELRGEAVAVLAERTTANARRLFGSLAA